MKKASQPRLANDPANWFRANVRAQLLRKKWRQQDLADASGIPRSSICQILSFDLQRDPTLETCQKLADGLGVQLQTLLKKPKTVG